MVAESIQIACDELKSTCESMHQDHSDQLRKMETHAQDQLEKRSWWDRFVQWLQSAVDKLNEGLRKAWDAANDAAQWVYDNILPWVFGPVYLAESWGKWQTVAEKGAQLAGAIPISQIDVAIDWQGPAAGSYYTTIEDQEGAAKVLSAMAQNMQKFLRTHLEGLVDFLVKMVTMFVDLLAEVVAAAITFVGVVNPMTWGEILTNVGGVIDTAIKQVGEKVEAMVDYLKSSLGAMMDVKTDSVAVYALPGGGAEWPPASARMTATPPTEPGGPAYPGWTH